MDEKLISVIIPTYNRSHLIKDAIFSVLNQTYQNFELIIVDAGSTDNTREIIKSIKDERIMYIFLDHKGSTPASGRNSGIAKSKGEYIAFLDSDDLWLPRKLEKQIKYFEENEHLLLVSTNGILISKKGTYIHLTLKENKIFSFNELLEKNFVMTSSVLMKKKTIKAIGLLDEIIGDYMEDYDYWLRILNYRDKSIMVLKAPLIKYRLHETNITKEFFYNTPLLLKRYNRLKYIFEKHIDRNQNYLKEILKERQNLIKISIMDSLLLQRKISLSHYLKFDYIKIKHKSAFLLKYYYSKFLKKYLKFVQESKIAHSLDKNIISN